MSVLAAIGLPLLLAVLLAASTRTGAVVYRLVAWTPLVLLWPILDPARVEMKWPLLSLTLEPDSTSFPLMILTAIAWSLAGWFAADRIDRNRRWFWAGWMSTLGGMNLLLLAQDIAGFYFGYALLSVAAYLLVTHSRTDEAWRAGRIYIVLALLGEAAILSAVLLMAGQIGNAELDQLADHADLFQGSPIGWLLLAGFAVKLGILPLHVWLPLAHPAAPVPASAILSGVIVKAGLLGWLRFSPMLTHEPVNVGSILLTLGMLTTFIGAALGMTQTRLKALLAYSTISQMGLVLVWFSLLYFIPETNHRLIAGIGLMALHHGLNKSALFLACGNAPGASRWRLLLFAVPALSVSAAPLTTGYLVKNVLKEDLSTAGLGDGIAMLIALSSLATGLLLWKAWNLARAMDDSDVAIHPSWLVMTLAAVTIPWLFAMNAGLLIPISLAKVWDSLWPLALALVLATLYVRLMKGRGLRIPEGDLVVLFEAAWKRRPGISLKIEAPELSARFSKRIGQLIMFMEQKLQSPASAGLAMLLVGGLVWLAVRVFA